LSDQHSKKITGQILNVDGGKNLTVRGQMPWYGMPPGKEGKSWGLEAG